MQSTKSRSRLESRLREVLGPGEAETLMRHLPHNAPGDLALREDVRALAAKLEPRLDQVEHRMTRVEHRMDHLEDRMTRVEHRMIRVEHRMDHLGQRMDHLEQRMDRLERRLEQLELGVRQVLHHMVAMVETVEGIRGDFRLEINQAVVRSTRTTVLAMAGTIVGSSSLALVVMATFGG